MRAHKPKGSVVFNQLRATWNFLWCEGTQRKSCKLGTRAELPTKADALRKADAELMSRREVLEVVFAQFARAGGRAVGEALVGIAVTNPGSIS